MQTNARHRSDVVKVLKCKVKDEQSRADYRLGCRYSFWLELPYFRPPTAGVHTDLSHGQLGPPVLKNSRKMPTTVAGSMFDGPTGSTSVLTNLHILEILAAVITAEKEVYI